MNLILLGIAPFYLISDILIVPQTEIRASYHKIIKYSYKHDQIQCFIATYIYIVSVAEVSTFDNFKYA